MAKWIRNIFISHRQEDEGHINPLKGSLRKAGLNVRDSSVYSGRNTNRAKNQEYIRHLLRSRIRWAGTLLVLVSKATRRHDWVNWEIEYAHRTGTRIVGIWAPGEKECAVPEALRKYANAMIPDDPDMIKEAIDGKIEGWHNEAGRQIAICNLPNIKCK
ncbi:TIR domain-containing protein [Azospirillum brasilense]|uniref:TIR domain-containing protein n=1 Tax=Azospirillum brasilense TaxID=192 RepID=UPI001909FD41|nr:TIR domain-containing protein [Azospirillum brasilense]